jgi:hypothetical protein
MLALCQRTRIVQILALTCFAERTCAGNTNTIILCPEMNILRHSCV